MAAPVITHAKVSGKAQGTDATRVYGNHWDAPHVITGLENVPNIDTTNASNLSSGTLPAARLPTPTSTTLGAVESLVATSHQFLTSIGTDGVPTKAQPAFTDISGVVTLAQLPAAAGSTGAVTMFPASAGQLSGAWMVLDPYGAAISTTGTTTCGLQEAINYAANNGFPLQVKGHGATTVAQQTGTLNSTTTVTGLTTSALTAAFANGRVYVTGAGIPGNTWISTIDSSSQIHLSNAATTTGSSALRFANNLTFLACTTGIIVPPAEQWSCRFDDVNITFSTTVNGPCFTFDSCMIVSFEFYGGQIVGQPATPGGTSYLIYFNPTNPVPLDGVVTITGSRFFINNLAYPASGGSAQAVMAFNVGTGSIDNCFFGSCELNGTGTGVTPNTLYGIEIFGATASTAFEQNIIDISDIHLTSSACVQVGVSSTNAANYRQNEWRLSGLRPAGSGDGFNTFGSKDTINIGGITNEEGSYGNGVKIQSGAVGNQIKYGAITGFTTAAIADSGSSTTVITGGSITSALLTGGPLAASIAEIRATSGVDVGSARINLTGGSNGGTAIASLGLGGATLGPQMALGTAYPLQTNMALGLKGAGSGTFYMGQLPGATQYAGMWFTTAVPSGTNYGFIQDSTGVDPALYFNSGPAGTPGSVVFSTGTTTRVYVSAAGGLFMGTGTTDAGAGSILATGSLKSNAATSGIGYATGAGGTVTQATSKATGVTLSKASGQITMNNAALAAATIVSFVLTNTAIAATDVLVMNHVSGGTVGSYLLNAQCAAGSATINVRNETAGSLSEAVVIQFVLIKGVTA